MTYSNDSNNNQSKINTYESLMKKYSLYEPTLLSSYFKCLFNTYSADNCYMPYLNFYKFLSWPFFLAEKLYNTLKRINEDCNALLSKDAFALGLSKLFGFGSLEVKAQLLFELIDFNDDGIILQKDMKIVLAQFVAMSKVSDIEGAFGFVDLFFKEGGGDREEKGEFQMTFEEYNERFLNDNNSNGNADVIYLLLVLIYENKPFDTKTVEYYGQLMHIESGGNENSGSNRNRKARWSTYAYPSMNLIEFLSKTIKLNVVNSNEEDNDDDKDLDELDNFEASLTRIMASAIKDKHMIVRQENHNKEMFSNANTNTPTNADHFKHALTFQGVLGLTEDINEINRNKTLKLKQSKSEKLPSFTLLYQEILGMKPLVTSYLEYNKQNRVVKSKLVIIGNDVLIFTCPSTDKLKISHIIPLKHLYLQSTPNEQANDFNKDNDNLFSLVLVLTHQNKLILKSLFFPTESKRNKLKDQIEQSSNHRNIANEYNILQSIGKGAFGTVLQAEHKQSKKQVALKIIGKSYSSTKIDFLELGYRERDIANFIKVINNKGIIQIKDTIETMNNIIIIQEYIPNGNLTQYTHHMKITIEDSYEVIKQLIHSISFLNTFGIVHRDIKADNILITYTSYKDSCSNTGHCRLRTKLIDFSLSTIIGTEETLSKKCGTLMYISPEMVKHKSYSNSIDIWTIGVIGYYLITGHYPFDSVDPSDLTRQIIAKDVFVLLNSPVQSKSKRKLIKIIEGCLQKDQEMRMKVDELIELVSSQTYNNHS